ncbi:Cytochrome c-type biogenesis protein Ccs1/ResB [Caballeronia glathei]|uniref:Cytochrome C biogenesis protein ResB n=1 Tax=Caballeronia glathei TaxID=60547 RepID=A0A069PGV9_9BURK|nr:cytochrome c biogenesis protein ResB [Caballeronia glathei]KDR39958.1 cytochrome C biogenesis protein ResB [Caballeronia glathei]CDY75802.1 Cytochrome c-type biogenesis protein Ccs1/ResB [Caballeronia glathei]
MSVSTSGLQSKSSSRTIRHIIELVSSMRFAIALLVILAIASIIGTVLTQEDPYPNYVNQFGPFWADIFRGLSLYSVYSAWWFMLILIFLVISVSLCVIRNGPKMIADMKSWKDRVREGSLRAFHHKGEFEVATSRADTAAALERLAAKLGYKYVTRETDSGATLIAAKRGALTKLGYISAHLAIVVICLGGLLDSNLPIKLQMWLFNKTPIATNAVINDIPPEHRLSSSNLTFRGYAWVPEGQHVGTAILNQQDGSLIQDLPFSIQLDKFIVDYYSTGMPKLFASDIVVIDHETGKRIPARIEVNKPFTYDGISIYQSSFQDGGSKLEMTAWPMSGGSAKTVPFGGAIGGTAPIDARIAGTKGETVEFTDFRAINVENITDGRGAIDARGVGQTQTLKQAFDERLGSGAKTSKPTDLRNVGPSVQYKVRGTDGQAREYNNYMLPLDVSGQRMFLAGMRVSPNDPFRYLRIPADEQDSVRQWMNLRAALETPSMRAEAAHRFAQRSVPQANAELQKHLEESAVRVLNLFAGADESGAAPQNPQTIGGFQAVAGFIDRSVPKGEQEKAAGLLLRMLEGATWDLWQVSRAQNGLPEAKVDEKNTAFVQSSINALSDSFLYGSPVFLQLDSFKQIQASVFQLTRAPGKKLVYLGSLLLVLGIFAMFYVRERRLWFWLKDEGQGGATVLMAMSTARRTFDYEKEFEKTRDTVAATLKGRPVVQAPLSGPTAQDTSPGSQDSTR